MTQKGPNARQLTHDDYHRGQIWNPQVFTNSTFWTKSSRPNHKKMVKSDYFECSLAERDTPVAATMQRKCAGGTIFAEKCKINYKRACSRELFCYEFGLDVEATYLLHYRNCSGIHVLHVSRSLKKHIHKKTLGELIFGSLHNSHVIDCASRNYT